MMKGFITCDWCQKIIGMLWFRALLAYRPSVLSPWFQALWTCPTRLRRWQYPSASSVLMCAPRSSCPAFRSRCVRVCACVQMAALPAKVEQILVSNEAKLQVTWEIIFSIGYYYLLLLSRKQKILTMKQSFRLKQLEKFIFSYIGIIIFRCCLGSKSSQTMKQLRKLLFTAAV